MPRRRRRPPETEELHSQRPWSSWNRQQALIPPDQLQAAHHRAAQLLAGGWGSITWGPAPDITRASDEQLELL